MKYLSTIFSLLFPYFLCLATVFILQRKLIYFPQTFSQSEMVLMAQQENLQLWPDPNHYRGLLAQVEPVTSQGTIIVFHGNAGSAIHRQYYISALTKLGYRVIIAEYPGYGARAGNPTEQILVADALDTVQQAKQTFGEPIFLWGESLGAGVVAGIIANQQIPVKGIVLTTPFDSMANVAHYHYWFLLGKWITRDKYNNIANLSHYSGNIAVLLAKQDEVIPNQSTLNLFNQLNGRKKLWQFPDADHNTLPLGPEQNWWPEVMTFVSQ